MTREEIEKFNESEPYCFETDREEQWYKVGLREGLETADNNPKSPWISVNNDLPCNHEELMRNPCIFKPETVEVLVKFNHKFNYKTYPLFRVDYMIFDDDRWKWGRNFGITHWMPIPKLPE